MGLDQVVVSRIEAIDVSAVGNSVKLSPGSTVAVDAGENEIPDLV